MGPLLRFASKRLPGQGIELCTDLPPYRTILLLLVAYVVLWITHVDRPLRHRPYGVPA